ncbi:hypothetical protein [Sphingobium olei]|uniref:Uncharacterized protein n=1 Tax=Sphingobium olei TaxID=420955 RepID=A0ABW3P3A7_9SPHN
MTEEPITFVSLAVATVTIPPANCETLPGTHLIGAGLMIATRRGARWRFSSEAGTIAAGKKEQSLLLWLADRLPMANTLIGWEIDQHVVPPLIDAAAHAEPTIAHHFMVRLARVLRNNVVDLSINPSAAPENVATAPSMMPDTLLSNWGTGRLDAVRADLATEAIGTWLHFLRQAQHVGADAEQATRAWMHRRSSIHLVEGAPGAA